MKGHLERAHYATYLIVHALDHKNVPEIVPESFGYEIVDRVLMPKDTGRYLDEK